jgi:uracil DNA glycosylase
MWTSSAAYCLGEIDSAQKSEQAVAATEELHAWTRAGVLLLNGLPPKDKIKAVEAVKSLKG